MIEENWQLVTGEPVEFEKEPVEVQDLMKIINHVRASPPILKNGWLELILWEAACKSAPLILQNGWFVARAGLEVEVGLQIGVIWQVGAPPPKQKRSPLNNKGQTPYSSPISKVPMRFILLLFLPCFITLYTSHGWVTRLANQLTWTYCEDDPPCIL
jgi:hypothetical protein